MCSNMGNGGGSPAEVDINKWGTFKSDPEYIHNADGDLIGKIEDVRRYIEEEDIQPTTKKAVLEEIDGWRNDDGTYGNSDTAIYLAYKDGKFVDVDDLDGKAYKKTGIVGASIATADFEMVWGGEYGKDGRFIPWKTWSPDGESGRPNTYSGYKATGVYYERVKTTYNNPNGKGGYKTVRQVLRRSTVKKLN